MTDELISCFNNTTGNCVYLTLAEFNNESDQYVAHFSEPTDWESDMDLRDIPYQ